MKRHSNTNEFFFSPSIHRRKQRNLIKQEAFNQNHSILSIHQQKRIENTYSLSSSSYTSLNSYLKDFHLSEKDFLELRKALQTIFQYLKHNLLLEQRLISPYLQNHDQSSFPLYTDEYFIRNGLLNHNDRPEYHHNYLQSDSSRSSSVMITSSPLNLTLPLTLLSNQQYFFNALTSNFICEKSRRTQSSIEFSTKEDETESIVVRRNKVQVWKRDNLVQERATLVEGEQQQQQQQVDGFEYHRALSINKDNIYIEKNDNSIETCNQKEEKENKNLSEMMITDDLFPMIKTLAPYIIIRDHSSKNINTRTHEKYNLSINHRVPKIEKRSIMNICHPTFSRTKRQALETSTFSLSNQLHDKKKNYLLAEFESVLTQISKR
ncbi:hypothetical protein I4U23_028125 [Adineta vaga]|nr:hypothetical protein I4U23_028125 [Adineta vaga]